MLSNIKYVIFLFLFLCNTMLNAQEQKSLQVIHLEDGSILKGYVEGETSDVINFQLSSGDFLTISKSNVVKIEKEKLAKTAIYKPLYFDNDRQYNIFLSGLLISENENFGGHNIGASLIHYIRGIPINKFLNVGIGVGLDSYKQDFLPIYLDVRGYLLHKKWSPYYAVSGGYAPSFDLLNNFTGDDVSLKGGVMIHPAIGIRLATHRGYNLLFEVGYKLQEGEIHYKDVDYFDDWSYHRISFRAGVVF